MRLIDADALYEELKNAGVLFSLECVKAAPTIVPQSNDPLTPEELREMEEDWVWVKLLVPVCRMKSGYYIKTQFSNEDSFSCGHLNFVIGDLSYFGYGDIWLAYRHKPEEETS